MPTRTITNDAESLRLRLELYGTLLREAANDLEWYVGNDYPYRDNRPDQMRRWKRDMDLVNQIREALGK